MNYLSHINAARILLAQSDPDAMQHAARILEDRGYNIHKAYYVGDALFALEHNRFDLAVIDPTMTGPDQHTLVEQLDRFGPLRWIALVDDGMSAQQFTQRGAFACIKRSSSPAWWRRQIEDALQTTDIPGQTTAPASGEEDDIRHILERQLVEQQTLSALARSLSAVLDLDVLLTQVVDAAVRLSNAEEGLLLLPEEEGKALYVRAFKGIDSETARNFRIRTRDTLAGRVFQSGEPILIGDQGWQKVKTEYLVKSLLYVPLSIKGEIIGVLGVNNKVAERTFNQHDSELLQDLAAHAAIAIENARLYEESVLRTRELSTLVQAGEAANSTLATDRVLSIIAGQLIGALEVTQCYICEWPSQTDKLNPLAVRYRSLWPPREGPILQMDAHPALKEALQRRQMALATPALPPDTDTVAWLPHRYHAQSVVYLPIFVQDRPLGVLLLYRIHQPYPKQEPPPYKHYRQLQQLALDMLLALSAEDAASEDRALFRITRQINQLAEADWCEVALWMEDEFHVMLSSGEAVWRKAAPLSIALEPFAPLQQVLMTQQPVTGHTADSLPGLAAGLGTSFLSVPLVIKGDTAGLVLLVDTLHKRSFSQREKDLAQALILQAANALDNARLFRDLELSLEELHRTQSKLVQTARLSAMGELAAAVAHQINNPLTTILGDTELIMQDLPPDDPNMESVEAILRAGKRAHEVVRRLLTMARQHAPDDTFEAVDVNVSIRNTLTLVKSHIQQGSVDLRVRLADDLLPVLCIRGELEDVWLNLLLNARDAVTDRETPVIGIASQHQGDHVMVEVWDNGIGISAEQTEHIFEPFFTTKPSGEGTGLGLHICCQIIEKCRGSISVQSAYNEGTCFTIYLPVYRGQDVAV